MEIPKDQILQLLRDRGDHDRARPADQQLARPGRQRTARRPTGENRHPPQRPDVDTEECSACEHDRV